MAKYTILIHPDDDPNSVGVPIQFKDCFLQQVSRDDYDLMKLTIAPDVTDFEFWKPGTSYIIDGSKISRAPVQLELKE